MAQVTSNQTFGRRRIREKYQGVAIKHDDCDSQWEDSISKGLLIKSEFILSYIES